jgi:hypothetical protein
MISSGPIFISHAVDDQPFAEELSRALRAKGIDVKSTWELGNDAAAEEELRRALTGASACVVLLSDSALLSPSVFFELGAAIGGRKKLTLVFLSDRARLEAPEALRRLAAIDADVLRPDEVADLVLAA